MDYLLTIIIALLIVLAAVIHLLPEEEHYGHQVNHRIETIVHQYVEDHKPHLFHGQPHTATPHRGYNHD